MPGPYVLQLSQNKQFYFNLRAGNNEIILTSETYTTKSAAQNGIQSVRRNSPSDERYKRRTSSDGKHYFVLVALNNEVIGTSELYSLQQAMENGIQSVKENGPTAEVIDRTQ